MNYPTCPLCAKANYEPAVQCAYCGSPLQPVATPTKTSFPPHGEAPKATAGVTCIVCLKALGDAEGWVQVRDGSLTTRGKHTQCAPTKCHPCGRDFIPNDRNLPSSAIYCSGRCAWSS